LGADVAEMEGLSIGDTVMSSHGFAEEGMMHENSSMTVVGVLDDTGTVLDRLILTSVETMWGIHAPHGSSDEGENHSHVNEIEITDESYLSDANSGEQITALLIKYRNPLAAAQFPRFVNERTSMQAAAPAIEITRLLNLLGVGLDAIRMFAYVLILASVLGIFIALLNSMKERKYDLAIMRSLGGSRMKLFTNVLLEGLMISLAGGVLGMVLGHLAVELLGQSFTEARQFAVTGFVFIPGEGWIIALAAGIGLLSSVVPAIQAYRTDIAYTLSKT
jgi:putative ABC transport system permease protein